MKKTTNVPRAWKMLLHNINETQLKVANNVVGIQYKPELRHRVTYDGERVEIHRTRFVR